MVHLNLVNFCTIRTLFHFLSERERERLCETIIYGNGREFILCKIKTKSRKLRILYSVHFVVNISSSLFLEDKILCETIQMRSHGLPLMWIVDGPHKSQGSTTTWGSLQASLCAFEEIIKSFSPVQILSFESYSWFSFGCGVKKPMQSLWQEGSWARSKTCPTQPILLLGLTCT